MSALSSGGKAVESAHSLRKQAASVSSQYGNSTIKPVAKYTICEDPRICGVKVWKGLACGGLQVL